MDIKLKIIEFSSDIFSKPSQLKDIQITPLFSNTEFTINIFDAIASNDVYTIRANTPIIKIGLYKGKSLLGTGELSVNKKVQKIKITSENKNIYNENTSHFIPDSSKSSKNDYFLSVECTLSNQRKNSPIRNRKKMASVDALKTNSDTLREKKYMDTTPPFNKNKNVHDKKNFSVKKSNNKLNTRNILTTKENQNNEKINNLKSNMEKITTDINNNEVNINGKYNNEKNNIEKNDKLEDNKDLDDTIENESYCNKLLNNTYSNNSKVLVQPKTPTKILEDKIVNQSFENEIANDNLIMNAKDYESNELNNFLLKLPKIDINSYNNLLSEFNFLLNKIRNFSENKNIFVEYKIFIGKLCELLAIYKYLFNTIEIQNFSIKKYLLILNQNLRFLNKKKLNIKIRNIKRDIKEIFDEKIYTNYYQNEINNINNKFSLLHTISNDKQKFDSDMQMNKDKICLKLIFETVLKNSKNKLKLLKEDESLLKKLKLLNIQTDFDNKEEEETVDIEILKNKINNLKQKYLDDNRKIYSYNNSNNKTGRGISKSKQRLNTYKNKKVNRSYSHNGNFK